MTHRKYELKKRAQRQEETRQRIVEAAVHLHQTVGGQAATISAIADEAGVERLTVYRHFPDERSLLSACTSHYFEQHPPPDPAPWRAIADPKRCLRAVLTDIYAYHRETEAMMISTYRDLDSFPLLQELLASFLTYWVEVQNLLTDKLSRDEESRALIRGAVGLAISFSTWRLLISQQGLPDSQAIDLLVAMLTCL
jgi:AcrR family transcriptional regulator